MALLILGVSTCPLCDQPIEGGQETVATTHFIESPMHPLWCYSDSVMHYGCFRTWEQRQLFVAEYNRLFGSRIWGNGTRHPMAEDGTVTTVSVAN
ncbi:MULTISPECIES: hypothetical protein [unclassified Roseateles]|uniref:hypothetical protein n=1 Tax=unclassified Roseateles TaxID=2626991 RepID=UPI0006FFF3CB|nr:MULTISPECIES: hypothetical protein [unclassified Roseateles]KQW51210.1 hypothetical protein ASC81_00710 [Pelomonas sp. Root405]KRA77442.1 hypothetical protein ASD88_00710 [Pelomonas sp. Root662]